MMPRFLRTPRIIRLMQSSGVGNFISAFIFRLFSEFMYAETFSVVFWMLVRIYPGQRVLTLMPYCLASARKVREKPTTACLLAE